MSGTPSPSSFSGASGDDPSPPSGLLDGGIPPDTDSPADAALPTPAAASAPQGPAAPLSESSTVDHWVRVLASGRLNTPVVGATVYVGRDAVATTDEDGMARFAAPDARQGLQGLDTGQTRGLLAVRVLAPGYQPARALLEKVDAPRRLEGTAPGPDAGGPRPPVQGTTPFVVKLQPALTGERYETVVVGTPPSGNGEIQLSGTELTQTPGALGDPVRVVESLPGVAQVVWPLALYAVRGSNPGNTGILLDGMAVPSTFHFALGPSVIHPYFIQSVDFYPGGILPNTAGF